MNNGKVNPFDAPFNVADNIFTATSSITGALLEIQCNNITVDGAGFVLQGVTFSNSSGITINANGVTVKNFKIVEYDLMGIDVEGSSNTVVANNITGSMEGGILLRGNGNVVEGNRISGVNTGITNFGTNNTVFGNTIENIQVDIKLVSGSVNLNPVSLPPSISSSPSNVPTITSTLIPTFSPSPSLIPSTTPALSPTPTAPFVFPLSTPPPSPTQQPIESPTQQPTIEPTPPIHSIPNPNYNPILMTIGIAVVIVAVAGALFHFKKRH
jgi:parallel beta-helix repeat protein